MMHVVHSLYRLFTPAQRRTARWLVLAMLGGMVLETLGVGMVIPAILLLTSHSLTTRFPALGQEVARLGIDTPKELMVLGMLALAALYIVKFFYLAWTASVQMRFVYRVQADMSRRLFVGYLHKPWTFHLQRNSAELVRNVVNATNELTLTGLVSMLILVTELLVLAGISALLLWIEPVATLVAAAFLAIFGYVLNKSTRTEIRRAGEARQHHEELRIRYLQQAIGGLKELKLLGREQNAAAQYAPSNAASADIGRHQATLQALPKLWLELLAVLGLVALVLTLVWQGKPVDRLVPTLGMFAAAAFRLIPSMNRILGSIQHIRFTTPTIRMLEEELGGLDAEPAERSEPVPLPFESNIVADGISVRYPDMEKFVLESASFDIARGTTVGFIGGSGAGKSTLVDALLGLLPLHGGSIRVDGVEVHADLRAWQAQIGYVPQSIYLTDDTLRRNIAFGLPDERIDEAAVRRAVAAAQLDEFVASLPAGLDTVTGERGVRLSGGQRQRIGIARALYHDPSILVLDEATSALDADTEAGVMQAIAALHGDKTILIVTHREATLRYCDRVVRITDAGVHEVVEGRS
jgi:ABC-type multidrug transport system fused ATPase/permease subunit